MKPDEMEAQLRRVGDCRHRGRSKPQRRDRERDRAQEQLLELDLDLVGQRDAALRRDRTA